MLFHQPSDSPKRNIWLYYAILRGDHVHLDICHWTTQSPQNGIVSNAPFWPTKLWERPIANTPRSSGRKLIGFKQRVHSLDLLHGNWNHPGWPIFFFERTKRETQKKGGGGTGPLFLIQVGNQTRDVNQNNQSLRMNLYIEINGYIHYTIERRDVLTGVNICYGTNETNTPTMEVNAIDLDHSKSISFTMCQVDGLVNQT